MKKENVTPGSLSPIFPYVAATGLCGGSSQVIADAILHPIDLVKTRMQSQGQINGFKKYNTSVKAVNIILKEEGLLGLYRGIAPASIGTFTSGGIYFGCYEYMKHKYLKKNQSAFQQSMVYFWSGFVADFFASFCYVPCEVVKQRMQLMHLHNVGAVKLNIPHYHTNYNSTIRALYTVAKYEGIRKGLFAGFFATISRDCPYTAFQFLFYEQLKNMLLRYKYQKSNPTVIQTSDDSVSPSDAPSISPPSTHQNENNESNVHFNRISFFESYICGGIAGAVAAQITNPFDVVKTRIQVQDQYAHLPFWSCFKKIYKEEGITAFWKGNTPRTVWLVSASAIIISFYEMFKPYAFQTMNHIFQTNYPGHINSEDNHY